MAGAGGVAVAAVLAAKFPEVGIGLVGVALAFGLTVLTMAFAIGHISGCHLNPAVSLGLVVGGRFKAAELLPYWVAQVLGAVAGAGILYLIASGTSCFDLAGWLRLQRLCGSFTRPLLAARLRRVRIVMTFMFLIIILGATDARAPKGFAPIAIGLGLTLIHLISIPVTNTSVNPARSTGPGPVRRRLGNLAVVAVLGRTADRRGTRGYRLSLARCRN